MCTASFRANQFFYVALCIEYSRHHLNPRETWRLVCELTIIIQILTAYSHENTSWSLSEMAPILYRKNVSPPCRSVLMTAKALDLELILKDVDIFSNDQMEEDFVQMNPQHTIPVLDDDGLILCDSHAIITYLVAKYGGDDSLYPADLQQRALVDQKLFFNAGVLQSLLKACNKPLISGEETSVTEKMASNVNEAYGLMEAFLQDREWMVGDSPTVADIAAIASLTSLRVLVPIDEEACPKLLEWIARMEEQPYYEANVEGLDDFKNFISLFIKDDN